MERAGSLGLTAEGAFLQLAHDRFGPKAPAWRSLPNCIPSRVLPAWHLENACGFQHSTLLRSLPDAHQDGVGGVLALADGLVSWGADGAIRLWSLAGEPQPGGSPKAHGSGGFSGMDGWSARA
jgi:hypothetical protein